MVLVFVTLPPALLAQSSAPPGRPQISGIVVDASGAVVAGAQVEIAPSGAAPAGGSEHTSTAADGSFTLSLGFEPPFTLKVSASGFRALVRELAVSPSGPLRIVLVPAGVSEQIVVTANRIATPLSETAASVAVLTRAELDTSAALTIDDQLRQIPGFTLFRRSGSRTANPTSQGTSLRGVGASGASRALVLEDGIPLNDPFGGWVYWGRIPRAAIQSIEVVRGGASALYGSDALAGVIDVLPLRPSTTQLTLETSIGNELTPDGSALLNVAGGGWQVGASAEGFSTRGYTLVDEAERGAVDTAAASTHSAAEATVRRPFGGTNQFFVSASGYREDRKNGTPLQTNDTQLASFSGGFDLRPAAGDLRVRVYGGPQHFRQDFSSISPNRDSEALIRSQQVPAQDAGGGVLWSRDLRPHALVAGFDLKQVRGLTAELVISSGKPTSRVVAGGRQLLAGVFAQDSIRLSSRWIATLGLRVDRWRNYRAFSRTTTFASGKESFSDFPRVTDTAFSPRAALLYNANDHLILTASGYAAFRAPTLNELYRPFRVGNVLTLANPDLQAERLAGGEAGAKIGAASGKLTLNVTGFWMATTHPITNRTLSSTLSLVTRQRQNLGRNLSRGLEIASQSHLTTRFSLDAGYQFVDATVAVAPQDRALEGLRLPQVPRHQLTLGGRFSQLRGWTAVLQLRASSAQFEDDQNLLPLAAYGTLDAFVSRHLGERVEIFAAAENLLNQQIMIGRNPVPTLGPPIFGRAGIRIRLQR